MTIDATGMHYQELCRRVKDAAAQGAVQVTGLMGQRYIGSGVSGADITLRGTPGNALGAYLDGGCIQVWGNAQDATGDTMNGGEIIIHGSSGDATGYAMRGGKIFVRDSTGYRAGIHMKAYKDKVPVLLIGGRAGNFLGEYQAGGRIVALGLGCGGQAPAGDFCGTGMHGGEIYLRCDTLPDDLPPQVVARQASDADLESIRADVARYCALFDQDCASILSDRFFVLRPDRANPYKQLYTHN